MMSEYIQAAYNKYEHDYLERTDDQLQEKLDTLTKSREYGVGARRKQIEREMSMIAFELAERYRERKNEQIEQCWSEHVVV